MKYIVVIVFLLVVYKQQVQLNKQSKQLGEIKREVVKIDSVNNKLQLQINEISKIQKLELIKLK